MTRSATLTRMKHIEAEFDRITKIDDDIERAIAMAPLIERAEDLLRQIRDARAAALTEANLSGHSYGGLAAMTGLTEKNVQRLVRLNLAERGIVRPQGNPRRS